MNQGERLKALRKALNIKQGDFARKISTTYQISKTGEKTSLKEVLN